MIDTIRKALDSAETVPESIPEEYAFDYKLSRLNRNDTGNGERLVSRYGKNLLYVQDIGWFAWMGTHWSQEDGHSHAVFAAQQTAKDMFREAKAIESAGPFGSESDTAFQRRVDSARRWALGSGNTTRVNGMINFAAHHLKRKLDDLDANPYLFNCVNGTLDMREADPLRPHKREDLITRLSPVEFNADAPFPQFKQFLNDVIPDGEAQIFMQRYCGYAMTGETSEQVMLLCHGQGANGKSTLNDLLAYICGDYVINLSFASLLHDDRRRGGEATPDLARLPGARLVMASEPDVGARFSESTIKSLTGGEAITARHLNQGFFEFKPKFKLLLSSNHMPSVRGQDDGIWRRMLLMPFDQQIPPEKRDRDLPHKLKLEAAGVLNWMLDGARFWIERGLETPDCVKKAVQEYRTEQDPVGVFLTDCTIAREGATVQATTLYSAYQWWCKENAFDPINSNLFGRMITQRGISKTKVGTIFRQGIELLEHVKEALESPATPLGSESDAE